jgi:signal transduction histidine kinase
MRWPSSLCTLNRLFPILIMLCVNQAVAATSGERRRIYFLETLSPALPASVQTIQGFRQRLREHTSEEFEIFVDYMELGRLPSPTHLDSTVNYLSQKYAEAPPDILITLGRAALPILLKHPGMVGSSVPILVANLPSTAVLNTNELRNAAYIVSQYDFLNTLRLAEQLQPNAQNLVIVGGASEYDHRWLDDARRQLQSKAALYKTRYITDVTYEELLSEVSHLPEETIVILSIFLTDGAGQARATPEVAADLARVSSAPVYSPVAGTVGTGVMGGYADDWEAQGAKVADIAFDILSGKDLATIPHVNASQHMNRIDARQLKRWHISESRIPVGSEVSFREVDLWEQYFWQIAGVLSLVLFQSVLITALVFQRVRRQAAETALRVSYEEVRKLAGRLINAQEEERSRIARELHDDVGQRVASLSIGLSSLKRRVADSDETVRSELSGLQLQTTGLAKDLRDLSHELHQGGLEHAGLLDTLRERCGQISRESDIQIELEVADGWKEVADDIKLCLYRVAQEALRNVAKHSHAKAGRVAIAHQNGQVVMRISDNGLGFATHGPTGQQGIGLLSMRERVRMFGGSFDVKSAPNTGTIATVTIPTGGKH